MQYFDKLQWFRKDATFTCNVQTSFGSPEITYTADVL
jgi:hypothetical protein